MACELLSHRTSRAAPVDRDDRIEQLVEVRCVASGSVDRKRLEQPLVGVVVESEGAAQRCGRGVGLV